MQQGCPPLLLFLSTLVSKQNDSKLRHSSTFHRNSINTSSLASSVIANRRQPCEPHFPKATEFHPMLIGERVGTKSAAPLLLKSLHSRIWSQSLGREVTPLCNLSISRDREREREREKIYKSHWRAHRHIPSSTYSPSLKCSSRNCARALNRASRA